MADKKPQTITGYLDSLESKLEEVFKKAPALSDGIKEFIVKVNPYITLIMMVLLLPFLFAALGLSAVFLPVTFITAFRYGTGGAVGLIFSILMIVLEIKALPGLFKRQMYAWKLMFYVAVLSALQNLLSFNLGGLVIGGAISCYFLFQIKSKYTHTS